MICNPFEPHPTCLQNARSNLFLLQFTYSFLLFLLFYFGKPRVVKGTVKFSRVSDFFVNITHPALKNLCRSNQIYAESWAAWSDLGYPRKSFDGGLNSNICVAHFLFFLVQEGPVCSSNWETGKRLIKKYRVGFMCVLMTYIKLSIFENIFSKKLSIFFNFWFFFQKW